MSNSVRAITIQEFVDISNNNQSMPIFYVESAKSWLFICRRPIGEAYYLLHISHTEQPIHEDYDDYGYLRSDQDEFYDISRDTAEDIMIHHISSVAAKFDDHFIELIDWIRADAEESQRNKKIEDDRLSRELKELLGQR